MESKDVSDLVDPEPAITAITALADETADEAADEALVDALPKGPLRRAAIDTYGSVALIDAMPRLVQPDGLGPEAAIVQAARVSYGAGTKTVHTDEGLLRYLLRHKHMTPFEMVVLKFRVRAPLFTARQWMRHRAGVFNEESARYSVITPEYYVPDAAEVCTQSRTNRQGSGEPVGADVAEWFREAARTTFAADTAVYTDALGAGIARELARAVFPEARYTTFCWTVNLRNLFGFLELRMDSHAQANIRAYADAIYTILRRYCPRAVQAFDDYALHAVTLSALEVRALQDGTAPAEMSARERLEWAQKKEGLSL